MELEILSDWFYDKGIRIDQKKIDLFIKYADILYTAMKSFNITGYKSKNEIILKLIVGSIEPLIQISVPRGTSFVDIGTGPGIPGIPIAIYFDNLIGVLIDSNSKKIDFVAYIIDALQLTNLTAYCGRAEQFCRNKSFRDTFDYLFSKAFGNIYMVIEYGSPLMKIGGYMYVYSKYSVRILNDFVQEHINNVGLEIISDDDRKKLGYNLEGILLRKNSQTNEVFPRTSKKITREIDRCRKKCN